MTSGYETLHYLVQMLAQVHDRTELSIAVSASRDIATSGSIEDPILNALAMFAEEFQSILAESEADDAHERGRMKRRRPSSISLSHITSRSKAPPSSKANKKHATRPSISAPPEPDQAESGQAEPDPAQRPETNRRTSEHAEDGTRRGRQGFSPRAATPIQEDEELRAARHMRRRSSPPSRGPKRDAVQEEEEGYRRRGSLPNNRDKVYHDQAGKVYERTSGRERRHSKEPGSTAPRKTYGGLRSQHANVTNTK